jgi:hypothetical protein
MIVGCGGSKVVVRCGDGSWCGQPGASPPPSITTRESAKRERKQSRRGGGKEAGMNQRG